MTTHKTGPKDVFMRLLSMVTLYFSAFGFGTLLFQYINVYFPDILSSDYYQTISYYSSMRWALSVLIVVFPVYIWTNWFLSKDEKKFPEKRELKTRKWLLYFTVFAAAGVIIGDLVALIFNFLQGEMTTRFALKILTILMVAAAVFGYYLWILRRDEKEITSSGIKIFIWAIIAAVGISIVAGFFIAGSPQSARMSKIDEKRVSDLQNLQSQIIFFWQQKNRLPYNSEELRDSISGYIPPYDPATKEPYEYRPVGDLTFELCANFETAAESSATNIAPKAIPVGSVGQPIENENWKHSSGYVCFERTIDPALWKLPTTAKPNL